MITNQVTGKWIQQIDGQTVRQVDFTNNSNMLGYNVTGSAINNWIPKGTSTDNYITSSATPINTGNLSTTGMALFKNQSNCVIGVYTNSGTTQIFSILQPLQSTGAVPQSGSTASPFWAKALTTPFSGSLIGMFSEY